MCNVNVGHSDRNRKITLIMSYLTEKRNTSGLLANKGRNTESTTVFSYN